MTVSDDERQRYLAALATPDQRGALEVVEDLLDRGASRRDVMLDLICWAQREVGARWQRGEWSVPQEHAATAISEAAVTVIMAGDAPPGKRGHVVVACVDDELHALPARIVAEVLVLAGWRVTYLGATTPAARLAPFLHELGPDAVALSCTVAMSLPKARKLIEASREVGVPVLAGGAAFGPDGERSRRLGANTWAPTAEAAVDALASLPMTTTPAPDLDHDAEDEYLELIERRSEILASAFAVVVARSAPMTGGDETRITRTRADLAYILDFVAAALYVGDETILFELTDWLLEVFDSRGDPSVALSLGLEALADVLDQMTGPRDLLQRARHRLDDAQPHHRSSLE